MEKKITVLSLGGILGLSLVAITIFKVENLYIFKSNNVEQFSQVDNSQYVQLTQFGAPIYAPTTITQIQNIGEQTKFVYDVVSLNEKVNGEYQSEFLFTLAVTPSDLEKRVYFSIEEKSENILCNPPENTNLQPGDKIEKNSGGTSTLGKFINQFHVICFSDKPISDDGKLFEFSLK